MTNPQTFDLALQHHRAGRLADAEALYRQILAIQPNHADALHLLGVIAHQVGRHDLAVEWIRQAIVFNPMNPVAHSNFGEACRAMGRLDHAETAYRRALELKPDYAEAHNNLGAALAGQGRPGEAEAAFQCALRVKPDYAEAYNNLSVALRWQGRLDEAIDACHRALALRPTYPEGLNNLGIALRDRGQLYDAISACRRALAIKPDYAEAHHNLAAVLASQSRFGEAIVACRRALQLRPDYVEAHNYLGLALVGQGQFEEAISACRRALQLRPDYLEALNNLGAALTGRRQLDEAIASYRHALRIKPDDPGVLGNLGNALRDQGELDEAIGAYRHALRIKPDDAGILCCLGNALRDQGELDETIALYRRALQITPDSVSTHSNLVCTLHFQTGHDERTISEEHQRWNQRFSDPLKRTIQPHTNDCSVNRRLRVGYVSPDFREHPVGRYALPLFERHDQRRFEILCYSEVAQPDWITERLRGLAAGWRDTFGVPDARLAEMIREDGVDILVDLAMHTAGNRLAVFARQPAPVQVTWLAYPGSTGLRSIDYRLTDAHMDPPGEKPAWSAEEPVRLPDCWCCYDAAGESPEINASPALSAGSVTFGSLNNLAKAPERVLALWARILDAVEGSRLVMLCPKGRTRERIRAFFGAQGIAAHRVELVGSLPRWEYLTLYHRIDLALDPFPCNGMTTTCDALWMGAPVLTLPGEMPASRAGLSLLSSIGLGDLAAKSEEDYLRMATELAADLPRLADLRATMRARMRDSPLMDAPRFARNVEAAYRSMWERWLQKQSALREQ
jgi:protein O-GlcNAc transferase